MANISKLAEQSRRVAAVVEKARALLAFAGQEVDATPAVDPPPRPNTSELKARGLCRVTVSCMIERWNIGSDPLKEMARRAIKDDRIYPEFWIGVPRDASHDGDQRRPADHDQLHHPSSCQADASWVRPGDATGPEGIWRVPWFRLSHLTRLRDTLV